MRRRRLPALVLLAVVAGSSPTFAQVPPGMVPPTSEGLAPPNLPRVRVQANRAATLERLAFVGTLETRFYPDGSWRGLSRVAGVWVPVCHAPCSTPADPAGQYRVSGSGIVSSEPFDIRGASGVDIDADGLWKRTLGLVTLIGGGAAGVVGAGLALEGATPQRSHAGVAFLGAGAGLVVVGAILLLTFKGTKVDVQRALAAGAF